MPTYRKDINIFGRLVVISISEDWTGWDCGLFSIEEITSKKYSGVKAKRFVFWRLAVWVGKYK